MVKVKHDLNAAGQISNPTAPYSTSRAHHSGTAHIASFLDQIYSMPASFLVRYTMVLASCISPETQNLQIQSTASWGLVVRTLTLSHISKLQKLSGAMDHDHGFHDPLNTASFIPPNQLDMGKAVRFCCQPEISPNFFGLRLYQLLDPEETFLLAVDLQEPRFLLAEFSVSVLSFHIRLHFKS